MRKKIAVIMLVTAMLTGCGNMPRGGTEARDAVLEAEGGADVSQTAGEKEDKEESAIDAGLKAAQTSEEPAAVSEPAAGQEPAVTLEPTAGRESTAAPEPAASQEPTAAPEPAAGREPTTAPEPAASQEPTTAPEPAASQEPTAAPEPAASQEPAATPDATAAPVHTCSWDGGSVTQAATCSSEGVLTYTCTSCGATRTESIAKSPHGNTITVLSFGQPEPDCFWGSKYDVRCEDCGVRLDTIYSEPLGHVKNEGVVTCLPDCTGGGSIRYTCTRCGHEWSEDYDEVQPHTWVEGIKKVIDWENGGTKEVPYLYCSVCGERQD